MALKALLTRETNEVTNMRRLPLPIDICAAACWLAWNMALLASGAVHTALSVPALILVVSGVYVSERMNKI